MAASPGLTRRAATISWVAQVLAAAILGQTLFFKFSAAPESVHIFTELGAEIVVDGEGDGGLLFALALTTFAAGALVAWLRRAQLSFIGARA